MTTVIGKYELIEQLGKGGFGTVYRAKDLSLEREVALKILHPQLMVDETFIGRFRKEARTLAKLEHPNIVPIHDLGEEDGRLFIAMRLLPGGSLRDRLKKEGHLSWKETLKIVQQIGDALHIAHTQEGLVHRDIKPENILFDKQGNAVLSDFGLVKAASGSLSSSTANAVMGTPNYVAPEIWNGEGASPASDQYALGCVVAEMLSGQQVFSGDSTQALLKKHLFDEPVLPKQWPEETPKVVTSILLKAMGKEPSKRYVGMKHFIDAFSSLGSPTISEKPSSQPVAPLPHAVAQPAPPVSQWQPPAYAPQPMQKKNSWIPWAAVGLLGIVAVIVGIVLGTGNRPAAIPAPTSTRSATHTNNSLPQVTATKTYVPATKTPSFGIGSTMTTADGMVMLYIPGGTFQMGMDADDALAECQKYRSDCQRTWFTDEEPVHTVTLSPYWIDSTEVTNAMYVEFLNQMGNQSEGGVTWLDATDSDVRIISQNGEWTPKSGYANHPVTEVSWYGAKAYCEWAGKQLPTEAQWEFAARGTDGRMYPWGDTSPSCSKANYSGCVGDTVAVGSYESGKSPFGVYDMAGNVWEWVYDWYGSYSSSSQTNPTGPATGNSRVLRGGSWYGREDYIRSSYRGRSYPAYTNDSYGFRCSLTP